MTSNHKRHCDIFLLSSHDLPHKVKYEGIIFILTNTIITVKLDVLFSNPIILQVVVNVADS